MAYGSFFFNGASDYITVADSAGLRPGTGNFTVEAWVYLNDYSSVNMILSKDNAAGDGGAEIGRAHV